MDKRVGFFLVVIYLAGIYTNVHFFWGGKLLVPVFVAGIAGFLLLVKHFKRISIDHAKVLALVLAIPWLSVLFKGADVYLVERLKGGIQISYSILLGYGFFLEVSGWKRKRVASLFFYCCVLIVIGCALENYTPFKTLSDNFRHAVFHENIYESLKRDIAYFGRARPKLFTSEPSHVAKFFLFSMTMWFALSRKTKWFFVNAVVVVLSAVFVTGNPSLVLVVPISLIIAAFIESDLLLRFFEEKRIWKYAICLVLLSFLIGGLVVASKTVLSGRFASIVQRDGSTVMRILAPPLIAYDVLKENPAWGVGVAAKEMAGDKIFFRLRETFELRFVKSSEQVLNSVNNFFWLHWIYLGIFGGGLMAWSLTRLIKALEAGHFLYFFLLVTIFGQIMGAYVGPRTWMIVFGIFLTSYFSMHEPAETDSGCSTDSPATIS